MNYKLLSLCALLSLPITCAAQNTHPADHHEISNDVIKQQRKALAQNAEQKGYGPQSPRDIDSVIGQNSRLFSLAPDSTSMNLCNIHFHKNAEHKGGEYTQYAGNGDGHGYNSGYQYSGALTDAELKPLDHPIAKNEHGELLPGDTIEVHYVYSSAMVAPGATLNACLSASTTNPQLRVEALVYVLVNDKDALDFMALTAHKKSNGYQQAINIPNNAGQPVQYTGSTTGPSYNETPSPFQVTWQVRPKVLKVDIHSVEKWLKNNNFNEDHAHGVRNLVINPQLLSTIQ